MKRNKMNKIILSTLYLYHVLYGKKRAEQVGIIKYYFSPRMEIMRRSILVYVKF